MSEILASVIGADLPLSYYLAGLVLVIFVYLRFSSVLDGPAKKGKLYPWKKDVDPAVPSDSSSLLVRLDMLQFTALSFLSRKLAPTLFPAPMTDLNFYDVTKHPGVKGMCAITIDDCFCRQDDPSKSLMRPLRDLFNKAGHKVTFFTTLVYAQGEWREKHIKDFLKEGHELGNHCKLDEEYHERPIAEFEADLDETNAFIKKLSGSNATFFRAPSGKISMEMSGALKKRGMKHVMLDSYANDPHIPHAQFIADCMLRSATDGSVLIIHMPEKGFREWTFTAMKLLLEGLKKKNLRSVTLTELSKAAGEGNGKKEQ
jgi:peptidoglycan/xylan/chitin deacetylase (PgdA/CDA1 family)